MILHCEMCSDNGARLSEETAVAYIDEDKIKLPLHISMFTGILEDRGVPLPESWTQGWSFFLHYGHCCFSALLDNKRMDQCMKDGGPRQILTDNGYIEIDEKGIIKPAISPPVVELYTDEELEEEWNKRLKGAEEPDRNQQIFEMSKTKTNAEVGKEFGISPGRVSQIVKEQRNAH